MKHFAKIIVAVSSVSLMLAFAAPAGAVKNVTTHTKMTASDTSIHKGDLVKFKVTVTANKAKCIKNDTIHLLKNGSQVATGTTNDQGKVVFNRHPKKTAKWQAVFKGKKTGKHPNRLNCLGSASGTIKVVVKK